MKRTEKLPGVEAVFRKRHLGIRYAFVDTPNFQQTNVRWQKVRFIGGRRLLLPPI
jgi:hypothetical protein